MTTTTWDSAELTTSEPIENARVETLLKSVVTRKSVEASPGTNPDTSAPSAFLEWTGRLGDIFTSIAVHQFPLIADDLATITTTPIRSLTDVEKSLIDLIEPIQNTDLVDTDEDLLDWDMVSDLKPRARYTIKVNYVNRGVGKPMPDSDPWL
jgi:hypothetical protein